MFCHTKDVVYFLQDKKMAEGGENINWRKRFARGRARTLMETLGIVEAGEVRGRGRPSVNRPVNIGRAGVTPQNW